LLTEQINKGLCGEQDGAGFEGWNQLNSFADLLQLRGSMLAVGRQPSSMCYDRITPNP
jgi:hypothetical protein